MAKSDIVTHRSVIRSKIDDAVILANELLVASGRGGFVARRSNDEFVIEPVSPRSLPGFHGRVNSPVDSNEGD